MKLHCAVCQSTLEEPVDRISYTSQVMELWAKLHARCMEVAAKDFESHEQRLKKLEAHAHYHGGQTVTQSNPVSG